MRGFTLIELMIVITIISIVALIASLSAVSWIRESTLNEQRDLLLSSVEDVKLRSITGVPHAIFVNDGKSTNFTVRNLTDDDSDFVRDASEGTTVIRTTTLPGKFKVSLNGGDELWFDRKGVPRTNSWGTLGRTLTLWHDGNGNDAIDANEIKREIILSSMGRVQYEKR